MWHGMPFNVGGAMSVPMRIPLVPKSAALPSMRCHLSRTGVVPAVTCRDLGRDLSLFDGAMALGDAAVCDRERFIRVVRRTARRLLGPEVEVSVHGSYKADLCVPGSDVDIAISGCPDGPMAAMRALATAFENMQQHEAEALGFELTDDATRAAAEAADTRAFAVNSGHAIAADVVDTLVGDAVTSSVGIGAAPLGTDSGDVSSAAESPSAATTGGLPPLAPSPATTAAAAAGGDNSGMGQTSPNGPFAASPSPASSMPLGSASPVNQLPPPFTVETVPYARVPIIKLTENATGVHGDVACGGGDPTRSHEFVLSLVSKYPVDGRRLILLLKALVRQEGIAEGIRGGISSFAIYLLVAHFLSQREAERAMLDSAIANATTMPAAASANDSKEEEEDGASAAAATPAGSATPGLANSPPLDGAATAALDDLLAEGLATTLEPPAAAEAVAVDADANADDDDGASSTTTPTSSSTTRSGGDGAEEDDEDEPDAMDDLDGEAGELFVDFCYFYGHAFDFATKGIRFYPDGRSEEVPKPEMCSKRNQFLHMTSPFDPEYDITQHMSHLSNLQMLLTDYLARLLDYNASFAWALFNPMHNPFTVYPLARVLSAERWLAGPGPIAVKALTDMLEKQQQQFAAMQAAQQQQQQQQRNATSSPAAQAHADPGAAEPEGVTRPKLMGRGGGVMSRGRGAGAPAPAARGGGGATATASSPSVPPAPRSGTATPTHHVRVPVSDNAPVFYPLPPAGPQQHHHHPSQYPHAFMPFTPPVASGYPGSYPPMPSYAHPQQQQLASATRSPQTSSPPPAPAVAAGKAPGAAKGKGTPAPVAVEHDEMRQRTEIQQQFQVGLAMHHQQLTYERHPRHGGVPGGAGGQHHHHHAAQGTPGQRAPHHHHHGPNQVAHWPAARKQKANSAAATQSTQTGAELLGQADAGTATTSTGTDGRNTPSSSSAQHAQTQAAQQQMQAMMLLSAGGGHPQGGYYGGGNFGYGGHPHHHHYHHQHHQHHHQHHQMLNAAALGYHQQQGPPHHRGQAPAAASAAAGSSTYGAAGRRGVASSQGSTAGGSSHRRPSGQQDVAQAPPVPERRRRKTKSKGTASVSSGGSGAPQGAGGAAAKQQPSAST